MSGLFFFFVLGVRLREYEGVGGYVFCKMEMVFMVVMVGSVIIVGVKFVVNYGVL